MRVLHVALNGGGRQLGLVRALQSMGDYLEFDWQETMRIKGKDRMRASLVRQSNKFKPDFTFFQIQNDIFGDELKEVPGVKFNWCGDVRTPTPDWYFKVAPHFNCTLFTNEVDINNLRKRGLRSDYLQIGFDENVFTPEGSTGDYPPIVFLGSNYGTRFPESGTRNMMVRKLTKQFKKNFGVYGHHWGTKFLDHQQEAECYRSCKIAINQNHFNYARFSSDRIVRLMGSGAFCLSNYYEGIEKEYEIGKHLDVFRTIQDLIVKIDYYIVHEREREKIRKAGVKHVRNNHTWMARIPEIKRLIKQYGSI